MTADLGTDEVVTTTVGPQGQLGRRRVSASRPGAGPRHVAFVDDHLVCVVNELDSTVTSAAVGPDGGLEWRARLALAPEGLPAGIIAAGSSRVVVSVRTDSTVTAVRVDADGSLRLLGTGPCGGRWPRAVGMSPDGDFIVVANQHSDEVTVLRPPPEGAGAVLSRLAVPAPACVAVRPST
jgi:6-phosphogluconolactonase (cycloisomerase 2 family)